MNDLPKSAPPLLRVQNLKTHFPVETGFLVKRSAGSVKAVDGVSFELGQGEILGLVGESGCGKSTLGRTILQLIRPTEGDVLFAGCSLANLDGGPLRQARASFQMIFQDPYATLNPRMTVFDMLSEAILAHRAVPGSELPARVNTLLQKVGLPPRTRGKYPHEFSGGQRQRLAIARAVAVEPRLIVADEPVSALDVSIQAQIINLLARVSREMGLALIFISHDLSVVHYISDRIAVMYLGRIVEIGPASRVFEHPLHPYTQALISAIPIPDPIREAQRKRVLPPGDPPSPLNPPSGCPFHPRCPHAQDRCAREVPSLEPFRNPNHLASCLRTKEINSRETISH
ncbi:MAG TPA: oligopeptide/dipeptide ABC transporter ATP-binding protein [Verrucomicrobiae bacterium]